MCVCVIVDVRLLVCMRTRTDQEEETSFPENRVGVAGNSFDASAER